MEKQAIILRYDGKFEFPGECRQWTIVSDWYDAAGANRKGGSFMLGGLIKIGVIRRADVDFLVIKLDVLQ